MLFRSKVKRSENGVITDPFYLSPDHTLQDAEDLMRKFRISGVPICEGGKLVGIITNRDLKFETDFTKKISESMTSENLITAPEGITLEEAKKILAKARKEKLPIVDKDFHLKGLGNFFEIIFAHSSILLISCLFKPLLSFLGLLIFILKFPVFFLFVIFMALLHSSHGYFVTGIFTVFLFPRPILSILDINFLSQHVNILFSLLFDFSNCSYVISFPYFK